MGLNPRQPWRIWPEETRRHRTRRLSPALLSISDQTSAVGGLAACVSGGREGRSHGGEAEHVSPQHIVRYLQYSLILPSAAPRVVCSSPI